MSGNTSYLCRGLAGNVLIADPDGAGHMRSRIRYVVGDLLPEVRQLHDSVIRQLLPHPSHLSLVR